MTRQYERVVGGVQYHLVAVPLGRLDVQRGLVVIVFPGADERGIPRETAVVVRRLETDDQTGG